MELTFGEDSRSRRQSSRSIVAGEAASSSPGDDTPAHCGRFKTPRPRVVPLHTPQPAIAGQNKTRPSVDLFPLARFTVAHALDRPPSAGTDLVPPPFEDTIDIDTHETYPL